MGAARLQLRHAQMHGGLQFEFGPAPRGILEEDRCHQRYRQHRHDLTDRLHQVIGDAGHLALALVLAQVGEAQPVLAAPGAHRHRRAEIDAGVAEAVPVTAHGAAQLGRAERQQRGDGLRAAAARQLRVELAQLRAVLEHAIVVQAHRQEDQIAAPFALALVEFLEHVGQQPEARRAQPAVQGQPALGEHRLGHTALGGHLDVACQHDPIQGVAGVAPHEEGAHGTDQLLQAPDPSPFADRVGQGHPLGGQEGHQDVIHVAAVIDHEHQRRARCDGPQRGLVGEADPHPVQQPGDRPRHRVADPEVDVGVERRHDLAHIAVNPRPDGGDRLLGGLRMLGDRGLDARIVEQPVDQRLAPGQLERGQFDRQPAVQPLDHAVDAPTQEPAHARGQHQHQHRPGRQEGHQQKQPAGQGDQLGHGGSAIGGSCARSAGPMNGDSMSKQRRRHRASRLVQAERALLQ